MSLWLLPVIFKIIFNNYYFLWGFALAYQYKLLNIAILVNSAMRKSIHNRSNSSLLLRQQQAIQHSCNNSFLFEIVHFNIKLDFIQMLLIFRFFVSRIPLLVISLQEMLFLICGCQKLILPLYLVQLHHIRPSIRVLLVLLFPFERNNVPNQLWLFQNQNPIPNL